MTTPDRHATHVVVDGHDGWTFWKDADGSLFTGQTAAAFAGQRNAEMKPEHRAYRVFALTPDIPEGRPVCTNTWQAPATCACCGDPAPCQPCADAGCGPGLECGRDDASAREHDRAGWR